MFLGRTQRFVTTAAYREKTYVSYFAFSRSSDKMDVPSSRRICCKLSITRCLTRMDEIESAHTKPDLYALPAAHLFPSISRSFNLSSPFKTYDGSGRRRHEAAQTLRDEARSSMLLPCRPTCWGTVVSTDNKLRSNRLSLTNSKDSHLARGSNSARARQQHDAATSRER
eukprot:753634-Hanusia_phi.AAC.1